MSVAPVQKHSFLLLTKIKQEDIHYMHVTDLLDSGMRAENMQYLRKTAPSLRLLRDCTWRNLKGLHVIDQRVPLHYGPSLFVANGDFLNHEQPHYLQA